MPRRASVHAIGRYGVYLCPDCAEAFSKETKVKRTRCPRCFKPVDLQKHLPMYQTDEPGKAAEGVRYLNIAHFEKKGASELHREIEDLCAGRMKPARGYPAFVAALDTMAGPVTLERLKIELKGFKHKELEGFFERAIAEGVVVEKKNGYAVVRP